MGANTSTCHKEVISFCLVVLESGRFYKFHGRGIGTFILKGGSCGSFAIQNGSDEDDDCNVKIWNERGVLVFPKGSCVGGTVIFLDNFEEGNTSVVYSRINRKYDPQRPIRVCANTGELQRFGLRRIHLTGSRNFILNGSSSKTRLVSTGSGVVTVNGDLSSLKVTGFGETRILGSVRKNVGQIGGNGGSIFIDGNVGGHLQQNGLGRIEVGRSVYGNIEQSGSGFIGIRRGHYGGRDVFGKGRMTVGGGESGDSNKDNSLLELFAKTITIK